jgi:aminoglycoside 9-adenylyltransferase
MNSSDRKTIPKEAIQAYDTVLKVLGSAVVGVYLFGSAVLGGLRVNSDVDVLVVVNQSPTKATLKELVGRLMKISGRQSVRPLEVTIINLIDVVPWQYPPKSEFLYGEWLRNEFEQGQIPEPTYDPDLVIVLKKVRKSSISLVGPDASEILDPVPMAHIRRAIRESLPKLIEDINGDERNVILTLSRMWLTASVGEISRKDVAAEWALIRLPKELHSLLDYARRSYLGECDDKWEGRESEVTALVTHMKQSIEVCLDTERGHG